MIDQGNLINTTFAVPDAPEVHHEIEMLNIDNELIRERVEEDMDFKIPGLPHSTVKRLLSANVRELIQKIEKHPHRHALQRDLQQSQSFNPFSQESKQMIHDVGNIELCELPDTARTQDTVQGMFIILGRRHRLLHMRALLANRNRGEQEIHQVHDDFFSILDYYIKKGQPHGHRYGRKPGRQGILHRQPAEKEVQKEVLPGYPRSICTR